MLVSALQRTGMLIWNTEMEIVSSIVRCQAVKTTKTNDQKWGHLQWEFITPSQFGTWKDQKLEEVEVSLSGNGPFFKDVAFQLFKGTNPNL